MGIIVKRVKQHLVRTATAITRGARKTAGHAVRLREKSIVPVHNHLVGRISWYKRWHEWRWHKHAHVSVLILYIVGAIILLMYFANVAQASSTWTQSTWDGGSGASTVNQYDSATNIDTAIANQISLSKGSNAFSNSTFDSNVTAWNGYNRAFDNTQSYSASGSAKITAGSVASSVFYSQLNFANTGSLPYFTNSGDVNNDGIEDLVVPSASTGVSEFRIYNGNGDGTYASATVVSTSATSVAAADTVIHDFNGDGWNDIVVTYASGTGKLSYFQNNGSGGFAASTDYSGLPGGGIRPCQVEKGLVDNNTSMDFVAVCSGGTTAYVYLNNGSGTFTMSTYPLSYTGTNPPSFALVDINGDQRPEIVGGASTGCTIMVLPNTGGGFDAALTYTLAQCGTSNAIKYALTGGDVNNDGYADIAIGRRSGIGGTATSDSYYVTVLIGNSSNGFSSQTDYASSSGADDQYAQLVTHDFNGDGYRDYAISLPSNNVVGYYANNGNGTFATKVDYSTGTAPYGIAIADANADGVKDIVTSNITTTNFSVFINRTPGDAMTQQVNVGDTGEYQLEAYAYTTGAAVTSADAALWYNGAAVSTTFTASATPGWYKLTGKVTGANAKRGYGVVAKQGKTVYVDNLSVYKYASSGSLTSAIFDPGFGGDWGTVEFSTTVSSNVTVKVRTSNSASMSGATAFSSCSAITSGSDISGNSCVADGQRYIQYQVEMTPNSGDTPVFSSFTLNYSAYDIVPPVTNATDIAMYKTDGGALVAAGDWTNGSSPYFEWLAGDDNAGGAGLLGYCLYLGQDNTANPVTAKGILGTSPVSNPACPFIVSSASLDLATAGLLATQLSTSNDEYYLRIKAVDIVGNVFAGSAEEFSFKFDNTPPTNPAYISGPSGFINTKSATFTWPTGSGQAAGDSHSGVIGLQYRFNNANWYGDSHTGLGDINDLLTNDGSYTTTDPASPDVDDIIDGVNTIYFRTWDAAGNVSSSFATAALKVNTNGSPSEPLNLVASPDTNTVNEFAFSWSAPLTYVGSAGNLTYCYSVNIVPSISSCTWTAAGVTSVPTGAFATQPGTNTFYVVAKDESNNINYSSYASMNFSANTAAPGIPQNADAADVSVKATSNWRLAVTWDEPASLGAGVAAYKVYRSTSYSGAYSLVGTSSSTSYVDTGLSQIEYFYKVKACDSANNCGSESSIVSETPTGKFTVPANLVSDPEVYDVTTRRASITWSTDRDSDSKIAIGTESGVYSASEIGNSDQTTDHVIDLDNLAAGTTYYYKAKWTDEDGNTGQSQEYTFTTAPAPVLKEVVTQSIGLDTATIQFTTKDAAKVDILFGRSDAFGGIKSVNTSLAESAYQVQLPGLDDGTKYFYKITMYDSEGGQYQSSIFSFSTPPRPRISNLSFQPVEGEPTSTQRVTWTTNVAATSQIIYGKIGAATLEVADSVLKTEHEIIMRGLDDNSEYGLTAQSRDGNGNLAVSDRQVFKTALDTRPPKIFDIAVESVVRGSGSEARGQIIVTWKTDEPATSQVQFSAGVSSTDLNNQTVEDGAYTTDHIAIISDLSPSKSYNVRPVGADRSGNRGVGGTQSTIIGRATDSVISIIFSTLQRLFGFAAQ